MWPSCERSSGRFAASQNCGPHSLQWLAEDPFHPTLHSHKLKGKLAGAWACTVDYDNRLLFEFVLNPESGEEEILLLTMGTHDEVY